MREVLLSTATRGGPIIANPTTSFRSRCKTTPELGRSFEQEIREQPEVWERLAHGDGALALARAIQGDVLLTGSGSSLFAAQLGAIALRRRGVDAAAVAATEVAGDHVAYEGRVVVAVSQSGRSSDVLHALDVLRPSRLVALTNTPQSPLAQRSDVIIDLGAGVERAIPATKSVTASVATLLTAATLLGGEQTRTPQALLQTAAAVRVWLDESCGTLVDPAKRLAASSGVVILGTDYGAPVAREAALKFKEATYLHAEGFEAGEFRHGSAAMVESSTAVLGIVDRDGSNVVARSLDSIEQTGAFRIAIGATRLEGLASLGPHVDDAYNTLAWLATIQMLALYVARERGIDSDAPRGLTKAITTG